MAKDTIFCSHEPMTPDGVLNQEYNTRVPMTQSESRDAYLPGLRKNYEAGVVNLSPAYRGGKHY